MTRYLFLFDSYCLVHVMRPLWREVESVSCHVYVYTLCIRPLSVQEECAIADSASRIYLTTQSGPCTFLLPPRIHMSSQTGPCTPLSSAWFARGANQNGAPTPPLILSTLHDWCSDWGLFCLIHLLAALFLARLILNPVDGGDTVLRNIDSYMDCTVLYPRRW
jgi:hypothetical protein